MATNFTLDCQEIDCQTFLKDIANYSNLRRLVIKNLNTKDIQGLTSLESFQELELTDGVDVRYKVLFKRLSQIPSLQYLTISNPTFKVIPEEVKLLKNISRLRIINCSELDMEKSIDHLSNMPALRELALPINRIQEIPSNINKLANLELLDISNNNLTTLPKEMGELKNLEEIDISRNVLIDPLKSLGAMKGLKIQYLRFDDDLSTEDFEKLKEIFPEASIKNTDGKDLTPDRTLALGKDTASSSLIDLKIRSKRGIRALSTAYRHYPSLFYSERFRQRFDSSLFEERYRDLAYANTIKMNPDKDYKFIKLFPIRKTDGSKKGFWFEIYRDDRVNRYHRELSAFTGLVWVYKGPLSAKDFQRRYLNPRRKMGKEQTIDNFFSDIRFFYDEVDQSFTIELKTKDEFKQISAYPRFTDPAVSIVDAQAIYLQRFERYMSTLERRNATFHRSLMKERKRYANIIESVYEAEWDRFRDYMSDKEKDMTRDEWLEYYDEVVANEKQAVYNAKPSIRMLRRVMEMSGYGRSQHLTLVLDDIKPIETYVSFIDQSEKKLPMNKIFVINKKNKSFAIYDGTLGVKPNKLFLGNSKHLCILGEHRNGDIVAIQSGKLLNEQFDYGKKKDLSVKRYSRKISDVGQIVKELGLE